MWIHSNTIVAIGRIHSGMCKLRSDLTDEDLADCGITLSDVNNLSGMRESVIVPLPRHFIMRWCTILRVERIKMYVDGHVHGGGLPLVAPLKSAYGSMHYKDTVFTPNVISDIEAHWENTDSVDDRRIFWVRPLQKFMFYTHRYLSLTSWRALFVALGR